MTRRIPLPTLPGPYQTRPSHPSTEPSPLEVALRQRVRGGVRFGLHDRMLYATDASNYQVEPVGVVLPASIDDALEALRVCAQFRAPVLPRGGGTSLAGQCTNTAVVLDFSASCTRLLELEDRKST
ncbi:MAG: FAD-binding oxidoreductase, partial [Phycisphaerales bacterium JB037]